MDNMLVELEFACPVGDAARSTDGIRVLAVHFQRHSNPAHATDHGRPKRAGTPLAEARAEQDLKVNVQAEQEIEAILRHLEYQNMMLIALVEKLDADKPSGATIDAKP
jgi:hypothetical protein